MKMKIATVNEYLHTHICLCKITYMLTTILFLCFLSFLFQESYCVALLWYSRLILQEGDLKLSVVSGYKRHLGDW